MDSLHISQSGTGSSKSSSRSTSPCPPHSKAAVTISHTSSSATGATSKHGNASSLRPSEGAGSASGFPSSATISVGGQSAATHTMSRRRSPVPTRRDPPNAADMGTPHLPRPDPVSAQVSEEDVVVSPSIIGMHVEEEDSQYLASTSILSNGSTELMSTTVDEADSTSEGTRTRTAIEHMQTKIARTKDQIRVEQTARDENVNEYLKLASNADKQQLTRIKAVFEKKNQKSAQIISQLQKKLDSYQKKLRDLELNGASSGHRQPREMLRDMSQGLKNVGGNIRDGITGFSGSVMSKPREFAHLLKNRFGSADNINQLSRNGDNNSGEEERVHHGSATLPGGCSLNSGGSGTGGGGGGSVSATGVKFTSDEGSECSSVTSESIPHSGHPHTSSHPPHHTSHLSPTNCSIEVLLTELREQREEFDRLRRKLDDNKEVLQREIVELNHLLQEERFRTERLEEQVNDLTELHQNEVENLKQTMTDMEEKVQYQSEERLRDIHDMLESCQTKISKMEHQQLQHQQYVTLEGIDNSNARALVVKLINVVLTVLQVVLLIVATAAGIIMPFLRTRLRVLTTVILIASIVVVLKQWPEVRDIGSHVMRFLKETLALK
ncbi:transmembrane and coiled-coil domains protein 2 isoform X2 [Frankliniella occidentalis]|uniref:Transmembrane and coiled-coil domains protein 2 isoform X2 n=1 Tax=Frankliniella occidentalis TaxID=133901 RepID=A0A6J1T374_FRAOC|nr:transmembrane and coiled-coil domains protein 2 isoform X2 [Frankliniella occidentalis]